MQYSLQALYKFFPRKQTKFDFNFTPTTEKPLQQQFSEILYSHNLESEQRVTIYIVPELLGCCSKVFKVILSILWGFRKQSADKL